MTGGATQRRQTAARASVRRVLSAAFLVAGVIVGLVAMHTLDLHGTPAAQVPAHASFDHGATSDLPAVSVVANGDHVQDCEDCGIGGHVGMAMSCFLALAFLLLSVLPPRLLPQWFHRAAPPRPRLNPIGGLLPRAPSLHALCISRT